MLNWSQRRVTAFLATSWVLILEPVSWLTSQVPPCIVSAAYYAGQNSKKEECPTLSLFLLGVLDPVFIKLGDPHWVTAIATIAIAFFTIVLAIATGLLWNAGERHSERELRAYISIINGQIELIKTDKGRFFIKGKIEFKNSGKTPAYDFRPWTSLDVLASGTDPSKTRGTSEQSSIFGPGDTSEIELFIGPIEEPTLESIRQSNTSIFIWGEIDFTDAFGREWTLAYVNVNGRMSPGRNSWPVRPVKISEKKKN